MNNFIHTAIVTPKLISRTLFVLFLSLFTLICNAQSTFSSGYIVKHDGDTITGFIKERGNQFYGSTCEFRKDKSSDWQTFSPQDLQGFGIGGRVFITDLPNQEKWKPNTRFIEFLLKGKASLYYAESYAVAYKDSTVFVNKEKTTINHLGDQRTLSGSDYLKYSSSYFISDCFDLVGSLNRLPMNHTAMVNFIGNFNKCIKSKYTVFYDKKIKIYVGAMVGFQYSSLNFGNQNQMDSYLSNANYTSKSDVVISGRMKVYIPQVNNRFSVFLDGQYSTKNFSAFYQYSDASSEAIYTGEINYSHIYISLNIAYQSPYSVEVYGGFGVDVIKEESQRNEEEKLMDGVVEINDLEPFVFNTNQYKWNVGIIKSVELKSTPIFLDVRYSRGLGFLKGAEEGSDVINASHSLTVGMGFYFQVR